MAATAFFEYTQYNSGGEMTIEDDDYTPIASHMIFEAYGARDANVRAEQHGLYFDGVEDGRDCRCCGARWYSVLENYEAGSPFPTIYGSPVAQGLNDHYEPPGMLLAVVVYLNGNMIKYRVPQGE